MTDSGQYSERQLYYVDFEEDGEEETRRQVLAGELTGVALGYARDWLARFDAEREDAWRSEHDELARRAVFAAEEANAIASKANIIAIAAMISAVIAIAVSIVTAFLSAGR